MKIFGLIKSTRFLKKLKRPTKYFSKADTINLAQFLVRQSAAPSSAHQRGRASGVVDGIFHTGPPSLPPEPPLPDGHGQAPKDVEIGGRRGGRLEEGMGGMGTT